MVVEVVAESDPVEILVNYAKVQGIDHWEIRLIEYSNNSQSMQNYYAVLYYCLVDLSNQKVRNYIVHSVTVNRGGHLDVPTPDDYMESNDFGALTNFSQYDRLQQYVPDLEQLGAYALFENPENTSTLLKEYPFTGWLHGRFFSETGYKQANRVSVSNKYSQYLIFYSSSRVETLKLYDRNGAVAYSFTYQYRYLRGDNYYTIFKVDVDTTDYYDFYFDYLDEKSGVYFLPVYWGFDIAMTDDMRVQAFLPTQTADSVVKIEQDLDKQNQLIEEQIKQQDKQHQEIMDTGTTSEASGVGNGIFDSSNEKFGSLLYPVQWTIDTASALANVQATGSISLPAIFAPDKTYLIQFDILEKQVPQLFTFIRSVIFSFIAWTLIRGIYNLVTGGKDDS